MKTILTFDSLPAPECESLCCRPEVGTGNGQLLFAFSAAGYTSLTGIDYSPLSIELANDILKARSAPDSEHTIADPPPRFFVADILQVALGEKVQGVSDESWDLITDKGTYDAVCLSDELREGKSLRELYVESIARLLPKGGIFLITSCKSRASFPVAVPAFSDMRVDKLSETFRHNQATGLKPSWKRRSSRQERVRLHQLGSTRRRVASHSIWAAADAIF